MPGHGGLGKPAEFGQRDLGIDGADRVGGRGPARAEHHRDIGPSGQGGEPPGAGRRHGVRIVGHEEHHNAWPGQPGPGEAFSAGLEPRPVRSKMELAAFRYTVTWWTRRL